VNTQGRQPRRAAAGTSASGTVMLAQRQAAIPCINRAN
jgi:hypothetical protein